MAKYINDFVQGDTVKIKLNYGASTDLTGYEYLFTLKSDLTLDDVDAELAHSTVAGEYTNDDITNGIVFIVVPAEVTATIPSGKYYYGLQETSALGEVRTLVPTPEDYKDKLFVAPDINTGS